MIAGIPMSYLFNSSTDNPVFYSKGAVVGTYSRTYTPEHSCTTIGAMVFLTSMPRGELI